MEKKKKKKKEQKLKRKMKNSLNGKVLLASCDLPFGATINVL